MSSRACFGAALLLACAAAACGADEPGGGPETGPVEVAAPGAPRAPRPSGAHPEAAEEPGAPWFREAARERGIDFRHVSATEQRFDFPEIMGGGAALFDLDGDGDLDLYLVQSGDLRAPRARDTNRLYLNDGAGRFRDVTEERGGGDAGYGMGCAVGDVDGDGDPDLYVTNLGPDVLYRNDAGRLVDVTAEAGLGHPGWGTSAAFVDVDADGRLDLFLVNYLRWSPETERDCSFPKLFRDYCSPNSYKAPARDVLYRNLGGGRFEDVSDAAGIDRPANGLGVVSGDFDGDGRVDVYVANDMNANHLWLGDGTGRFREAGLLAGCALSGTGYAESGMGVQAMDIEGDGDLDLFLSHLRRQTNTFYLNDGGGFDDATARMGLSAASLPYTGFGLGLHDFDQDGRLDVFVANGDVIALEEPLVAGDPYAQPNLLFAGEERGGRPVFREVLPRGGTLPELVATSRGAAFGDVDGDGDVDVVVVNRELEAHLLLNLAGDRGGRWLLLDVRDRAGSTAVGALVEVEAAGRTWRRLVDPSYGYCSASDARVHVGLGAAEGAEAVRVLWPDGTEQDFGALAAGAVHRLDQAKTR